MKLGTDQTAKWYQLSQELKSEGSLLKQLFIYIQQLDNIWRPLQSRTRERSFKLLLCAVNLIDPNSPTRFCSVQ